MCQVQARCWGLGEVCDLVQEIFCQDGSHCGEIDTEKWLSDTASNKHCGFAEFIKTSLGQ